LAILTSRFGGRNYIHGVEKKTIFDRQDGLDYFSRTTWQPELMRIEELIWMKVMLLAKHRSSDLPWGRKRKIVIAETKDSSSANGVRKALLSRQIQKQAFALLIAILIWASSE
jgi:hypothetical protein